MAGKTKYKVGDIFYERKRIVEYCGSHPIHRVSLWKWECMGCGTVHGPSMTATLTRKDRADSTPKCCHLKGLRERSPRWSGYENIPLSYFTQIKYGASKRNINFNITIENMHEQWMRQNGLCALTGIPLEISYKDGNASLDRINSSIGYSTENIQWVHKDINRIKSDLNQEDFIELCTAVAEFSVKASN